MKLKNANIYIALAILLIGFYGYASYTGLVFWESKVEKSGNYTGGRRLGGTRFYHK